MLQTELPALFWAPGWDAGGCLRPSQHGSAAVSLPPLHVCWLRPLREALAEGYWSVVRPGTPTGHFSMTQHSLALCVAAGEQSELRSTGNPGGQDSDIWLVARSQDLQQGVGNIPLKSNLPHHPPQQPSGPSLFPPGESQTPW